jgi:AcrR family transcriptional regulator
MIARTDQKQETRRRIVESATRAIRERGLETPSVGEVMSGAGLTVGGFYAHFENKDAMMIEALRAMMTQRLDETSQQMAAMPAAERRSLSARYYLSRKHRDGEIVRCPLPAVLGELSQLDPRFRELVSEHIGQWVDALRDEAEPEGRDKALAAISTMVGALTLARALGQSPFSDEVLAAAKTAIR